MTAHPSLAAVLRLVPNHMRASCCLASVLKRMSVASEWRDKLYRRSLHKLHLRRAYLRAFHRQTLNRLCVLWLRHNSNVVRCLHVFTFLATNQLRLRNVSLRTRACLAIARLFIYATRHSTCLAAESADRHHCSAMGILQRAYAVYWEERLAV